MDTLLDALQEGRLLELPESDKTHALQFLSHVIEAIPEIPAGTDVVGQVLARETSANTALGKAWACPHCRVDFDEDLMCVVGWSPGGIDYGARDGRKVSIVAMYIVPANQRNNYLREISSLAKVLEAGTGEGALGGSKDLNDVRNYLLDLISASKETGVPDARARMIRLQARPSVVPAGSQDAFTLVVEPVTVVTGPGMKPVILTQSPAVASAMEATAGLQEKLEQAGWYQDAAWRLVKRGTVSYQGGRAAYDCLAIKLPGKPGTESREAPRSDSREGSNTP